MKTINIHSTLRAMAIAIVALVGASCAADLEPEDSILAPGLTTGNALEITRTSARVEGKLKADENPIEYGFLVSNNPNISAGATGVDKVECHVDNRVNGLFQYDAEISTYNGSPLRSGNTYYYCAYSFSGYNYALGEVRNFTTATTSGPSFEKITLVGSNANMADITTKVIDDGGADVLLTGFIYKAVQEQYNDSASSQEGSSAAITYGQEGVQVVQVDYDASSKSLGTTIDGLEPNRTYAIRAFGVSAGLGYSDQILVRTEASDAPSLSATEVVATHGQELIVETEVFDPGSSPITAAGFVWSGSLSRPTLDDEECERFEAYVEENFQNRFEGFIVGIEKGRTYYIRSYATNASGTGYGPVLTYTVEEDALLPSVYTVTASDVTATSATFHGVVSTNGVAISRCGFYLNDIPTETSKDYIYDGPFSYTFENLEPQTRYTFRAFIETYDGMRYEGQELEFVTPKLIPGSGDQNFPGIQ